MDHCTHICEQENYSNMFSKKRLPYNKGSFCKQCDIWVKEPSFDKIVTTVTKVYYDKQGNEILSIPKSSKIEIDKKSVRCPCCWYQCRAPYSKSKLRIRNKDPESEEMKLAKIRQLDDTIARLKIQREYENDPTLRLDTPEARKVGTMSSMVRGDVEKTLEEVEKLRNEINDSI